MGRPRQVIGALAAAAFAAQFVILDLVFGAGAHRSVSAVASVLLWGALVAFAHTRRRRIVVALLAGVILTTQVFVFRFYHVPLDLQIAEGARHAWHDIRRVVAGMLPTFGGAVLVASALELVALELAVRASGSVRFRRAPIAFGAAAAVLVAFVDLRRATPDLRAAHALGALGREPPRTIEGAITLPALHSEKVPAQIPDILFLFSESIRAEDYVARGEGATAPETLAVTPDRIELEQLRAVSSYSAVSLSAVLTARAQTEPREEILRAPNVFDFAHAARMNVLYYTGHSREMFETKDVRAAVDLFFSLETIAGGAIDDDAKLVEMPLDRLTIERFVADLPSVKGPTFAMLHFASTHAPYWFEAERAPFRPWSQSVAWTDMPKLRNAYKNAILEQDRTVARAIRAFVDHAGARPWFVFFTSDHGESFGERGAIHHGQNLYDEQIHVPAFVAASAGALSGAQRSALSEHRTRALTHLDILPTLLDVLGLHDNFSVVPFREKMAGRSLLRPWTRRPPLPITNCTGMFRCPLNTWGVLGDTHKLIAQPWDGSWRCLALAGSEQEVPSSDPACAALARVSRESYRELPNGQENR